MHPLHPRVHLCTCTCRYVYVCLWTTIQAIQIHGDLCARVDSRMYAKLRCSHRGAEAQGLTRADLRRKEDELVKVWKDWLRWSLSLRSLELLQGSSRKWCVDMKDVADDGASGDVK